MSQSLNDIRFKIGDVIKLKYSDGSVEHKIVLAISFPIESFMDSGNAMLEIITIRQENSVKQTCRVHQLKTYIEKRHRVFINNSPVSKQEIDKYFMSI